MEKLHFSKLLEYFIKESSYSIKKLSDETGINRTVLQKYISGNRFPSSYKNIELIANKITLSIEQKEMLYNAYEIEKIGYDKYERLQLIKQIIETINYSKEINDYDYKITYQFDQINNFATTKDDIIILISYIMNQANKTIKVHLPDDDQLLEIIIDNLKADTNLVLEMLLTISTAKKDMSNNIKRFQNLLPLIFLDNTYIKYQYEETLVEYKSPIAFPFLVTNENYTLLINSTLTSGILLENEANEYLNKQFDLIYKKSNLFCRSIKSVTDIINYYVKSTDYNNTSSLNKIYSFSFEPCIIPNLDRYIIKNKYSGDKEYALYVENFLTTHKEKIINHVKDNNEKQFTFYFTKSGLQSFYDTGRVSEIPAQFYNPFSRSEIIQLLKRMVNLVKQYSNYRFYLIKENKFRIPNKCSIIINDCNDVLFTLGGKKHDTSVNVSILEPTIKNDFTSLIDLIELGECSYDFDYSLKYVENFIKKLG